jgi:imidazolonepropionase-like amidohydrolase
MRSKLLVFVFAIVGSVLFFAQEAAAPQPKRLVIHAAQLLDPKTGNILKDQAIFVEGDKIVKVEGAPQEIHQPKANIDYPGFGANVPTLHIVSGTVMPGMIDVHTHLTMDPNFGLPELTMSAASQALVGAKNAKATLEAGFTSVRNLADYWEFADVALRNAINRGDIEGPRMQASGPAISISGGHGDSNYLPYVYQHHAMGVADGIPAVQHQVRENIKYGADVIKFMATGGVLSSGDDPKASQHTLEEMKAMVADAHRLGRKVAAHAHGGNGIIWASEAGVDSIEHGSYIDDNGIATLKKNGTYLVPTVYLAEWFLQNADRLRIPQELQNKAKAVFPAADKNVAHAIASGVKIAFGTDAAVYPHGLNARQFPYLVRLGMTPLAAIQSATVNAADLMGWSDKVGSIEPGKFADIIAVDGDPIKDVTTLEHVKLVVKGGVVYKNETSSMHE